MIPSLIIYRDALEEGYCAVSVDGVVGGVVDEISFNCDIVCADSSDAASAEVVDVKVLDGDMVATLVDGNSIASTVRWADRSCVGEFETVHNPIGGIQEIEPEDRLVLRSDVCWRGCLVRIVCLRYQLSIGSSLRTLYCDPSCGYIKKWLTR